MRPMPRMTTPGSLALTLTTGVPGITSALSASGKQGQYFQLHDYRRATTRSPSAPTRCPTGLSLDPVAGVISGTPLVSGTFPVTIGAGNPYGADSQVLTLTLASSVPMITSPLVATAKQGSTFTYTITASDPAVFSVGPLPAGLNFNAATGVIVGPPIVERHLCDCAHLNQPVWFRPAGADAGDCLLRPRHHQWPDRVRDREPERLQLHDPGEQLADAFGASDLPLGLTINTTNGVITRHAAARAARSPCRSGRTTPGAPARPTWS